MSNVIDFKTSQPVDFDKVNVVDTVYVTHDEIERVNKLLENARIIAEYEHKKRQNLIGWLVPLMGLAYWVGFIVARVV